MGSHKVYNFGRNTFGSTDEITFVFTIFIVDQNNHFAGLDIGSQIVKSNDIGVGVLGSLGRVGLGCALGVQIAGDDRAGRNILGDVLV